MTEYRDRCEDCDRSCTPRIHPWCSGLNVPVLVCDKCGDECDELYEYDGEELCEECLVEAVKDTCRRITLD